MVDREDVALYFCEGVSNLLDKRERGGLTANFLNFLKDFDTVPHIELLEILIINIFKG